MSLILKLNKETLRALNPDEMAQAHLIGGTASLASCYGICLTEACGSYGGVKSGALIVCTRPTRWTVSGAI